MGAEKTDAIARMLLELRGRTPEAGETGVQRISWAFGQVALSKESVSAEDERRLREYAEQAVCASYEEQIADLRRERDRLREVVEAARAALLEIARPGVGPELHDTAEERADYWAHACEVERQTAREALAALAALEGT